VSTGASGHTADAPGAAGTGLAPAFAAARTRLALIALLFVLSGVAWWSTAERMRGMDEGPGTDLGALGWFLGVWIVMMAAMMFPSVSPTVALYSRMARRSAPVAPLLFAAGYLLTWAAAGLLAYGVADAGRHVLGPGLSWDGTGRWLAGGTLLVAAGYELTPLKDVCLAKFRSPLGFLLGAWRDGLSGALAMGTRHGAWCVGCCWALMASLFPRRVDGVRGGADRRREDPPRGPCCDLRDRRAPARPRRRARDGAGRDSGPDDSEQRRLHGRRGLTGPHTLTSPTTSPAHSEDDVYWLTFRDGDVIELCNQYRP